MTAEKWSAVLEIVSFFLVTIDLFGKTRLIELQKRINEMADNFQRLEITKSFRLWFFSYFEDDENGKKKPVNRSDTETIRNFVLGNAHLFLFLFLREVYQEKFHIWWFWSVLLAFLSIYPIHLILGFLLSLVIRLLEFLLDLFLSGVIFLITKFNLQGLMLVIGAILFLTSKAIILFN